MYHEPRGGSKGSCGVWSPIPGSHTWLSRHSLQLPRPLPLAQASFCCTSASCRHVVHPEVVAPGPERVDLEDPNSSRRNGGPGHLDSVEEMIP